MQYKKLGQTDIKVSHVCLGTMTWGCQNSEAEAHEQMDYAVDQGVNFFDTAELYAVPPEKHTQGLTESYIGTWFEKTGKRDDVILASKIAGAGLPWIDDGDIISPDRIEKAVDRSLSRLKTDYIDLYQLHWPNYPYPHHGRHHSGAINFTDIDGQKETEGFLAILRALKGQIEAGKIRHIGLSNDTPWGLMKYLELSKQYDLPRISSVQNEYSLLYRHDDPYLLEACTHENVSYLPYSPLAAGALSGKYLDGKKPKGTRWNIEEEMGRNNQRDKKTAHEAVKAYIALADKYGFDMCQMALAFCYQNPMITSTIIGATSMDQLKSNIGAKDIYLSDEVINDIQDIYKKYPIPY